MTDENGKLYGRYYNFAGRAVETVPKSLHHSCCLLYTSLQPLLPVQGGTARDRVDIAHQMMFHPVLLAHLLFCCARIYCARNYMV